MIRLMMCLMVAVGFGVALAADDIPPPREVVDVAALVKQLGSEDYAEREAATKRLSTLKVDEVPPELLAALKSPNLEIRVRAAKALKALRMHIAKTREWAATRHLPRSERFAKRGQIDLYVASTAKSELKAEDPRLWEPVLDIGRVAIKTAEMKGDRSPHGCPALAKDIRAYKKAFNAWFTRMDEPYTTPRRRTAEAIQAPGISHESFNYHIVVSRGPVRTVIGCQSSLLLVTGDISIGEKYSRDISGSIVICDGDLRVGGKVSNSLIIARGSISIKGDSFRNTLIAGGTVTTNPRERTNAESALLLRDIIEQNTSKPLGYITFFELSRVGLEVKVADKVVRVTSVAEGKPFALAGAKVGDVVVGVNGKEPDSAESLRRLLRDALAIGDATVKVRRGEKIETLKVSLPE